MTIGDRIRAWFGRATFGEPMTARFATYPVDQLNFLKVLGVDGQGNGRAASARRIDRRSALSVPAVLRGRNLICSISTLPLELVDKQYRVQDNPLFEQFDPNIANEVMLATTIEDLLFEAVAWWRVTAFENGMPSKVARYAPSTVSLQPPPGWQKAYLPSDLPTEGVVWMEGKPVPFRNVIRFDSPNPALLEAGERAIRRAIDLDESADLYATNRRMRGYFTPTDPTADPGDDEKIIGALDKFALARKERLDGYVPAALHYNPIQDPTPAEIQILAQQQRADLAIANALGIDPEDLGISTTSRTYQNGIDRRQDRINDVLAPYMAAITGRLSMPDVTPPGEKACFRLDGYLKADPKTRAEVEQLYEQMGVTDAAEIRETEQLPPRAIQPPPAPPAGTAVNPVSSIPAADPAPAPVYA